MPLAGGTKHHAELVCPFWADAHDLNCWDGSLSAPANLIIELEKLEAG
jgi:oligoendopeptidase F